MDEYINRIVCMDALEFMRGLPDGCADLVVTSPPYNMRTNTNGAKACSKSASNWGRSKLLMDGYAEHGDNLPPVEYVRWQRDILTECMRLIHDAGAIFYIHKWRIQGGLLDMRTPVVDGFPVRQVIIWDRGSSNNHNRAFFAPQYEVIYMIAKRFFYINQEATSLGDVWRIPPESGSEHPAPFPEEIPNRIISSTDAQIILDPFMGSGTTALAALRLGRNFTGCDLSPEYVELARKRVQYHGDEKRMIAEEAAGVEQLELFGSSEDDDGAV